MKIIKKLKLIFLVIFSVLAISACINITIIHNHAKSENQKIEKPITTLEAETLEEVESYDYMEEVVQEIEEVLEEGECINCPNDKKNNIKLNSSIRIGVVTWGGYAGGQYWNNGFKANKESRFYKDYGFTVEFIVLDDFENSRNAFKAGEVDLLWTTVDAFPTEIQGLKAYNPKIVFVSDWSRGGDAVVVNKGIKKYEDLKGKKIAVAPFTPSHTLLLWLLEEANLSSKDVSIKEMPSAIDAADAFKGGTVDAAVVWSPDDQDCIKKVKGASVLASTKDAKYLIADCLIAKEAYIKSNQQNLEKLYEGWMKGVAAINNSEIEKQKAAEILAKGLSVPKDFAYNAISNVRLTNHGDNLNLFGLNPDYTGIKAEQLFNTYYQLYADLGYISKGLVNWKDIISTDVISNSNLKPINEQEAEK